MTETVTVPITFRALVAIPCTSRNRREYSEAVLKDTAGKWEGKPFLLDHESGDVTERAIGIISNSKYGPDKARDGTIKSGLWLSGFGRLSRSLFEKMTDTEKVPAIVKSVSIGAGGEGHDITGPDGRPVTRIHKLYPEELSCVSIPGIPEAHLAEVQRIQEAYRNVNLVEEDFPMDDKEALPTPIDTAKDSITVTQKDLGAHPNPMKNGLPSPRVEKDDDEQSGKYLNQPITAPEKFKNMTHGMPNVVGTRVYRDSIKYEFVPKHVPDKLWNAGKRVFEWYDPISRKQVTINGTPMPDPPSMRTDSMVMPLQRKENDDVDITPEEEEDMDLAFSVPDNELDNLECWITAKMGESAYIKFPSPGVEAKKNWIKKAIRKPNALRRALGIKPGDTIPVSKLHALAKKGGVMGRRARLALTLRKLHRK